MTNLHVLPPSALSNCGHIPEWGKHFPPSPGSLSTSWEKKIEAPHNLSDSLCISTYLAFISIFILYLYCIYCLFIGIIAFLNPPYNWTAWSLLLQLLFECLKWEWNLVHKPSSWKGPCCGGVWWVTVGHIYSGRGVLVRSGLYTHPAWQSTIRSRD